jgi:hypothetical protein
MRWSGTLIAGIRPGTSIRMTGMGLSLKKCNSSLLDSITPPPGSRLSRHPTDAWTATVLVAFSAIIALNVSDAL